MLGYMLNSFIQTNKVITTQKIMTKNNEKNTTTKGKQLTSKRKDPN